MPSKKQTQDVNNNANDPVDLKATKRDFKGTNKDEKSRARNEALSDISSKLDVIKSEKKDMINELEEAKERIRELELINSVLINRNMREEIAKQSRETHVILALEFVDCEGEGLYGIIGTSDPIPYGTEHATLALFFEATQGALFLKDTIGDNPPYFDDDAADEDEPRVSTLVAIHRVPEIEDRLVKIDSTDPEELKKFAKEIGVYVIMCSRCPSASLCKSHRDCLIRYLRGDDKASKELEEFATRLRNKDYPKVVDSN